MKRVGQRNRQGGIQADRRTDGETDRETGRERNRSVYFPPLPALRSPLCASSFLVHEGLEEVEASVIGVGAPLQKGRHLLVNRRSRPPFVHALYEADDAAEVLPLLDHVQGVPRPHSAPPGAGTAHDVDVGGLRRGLARLTVLHAEGFVHAGVLDGPVHVLGLELHGLAEGTRLLQGVAGVQVADPDADGLYIKNRSWVLRNRGPFAKLRTTGAQRI
jgi:hypothetical protein